MIRKDGVTNPRKPSTKPLLPEMVRDPNPNFVLVGSRTEHEYGYGGWTGQSEERKEELAVFDTFEQANAYVEASKLKSPKEQSYPFKTASLLAPYEFYEILDNRPTSLPHNPVFQGR
jgi:hypothetical protein